MTAPGGAGPGASIGALVARGREAEIWDLGDGTVLKLFFDTTKGPVAAREAHVLAVLRASGIRVPAVLAETVVDARPGLVLERVAGVDMLTLIGRQPWRALTAGRVLARVHAALHEVQAPDTLASLTARLRARLSSSPHLGEDERARLLSILEAQRDGTGLCHGDLHLENLLGTPPDPTVIDWTAATSGPPAADVARTWVILQFGEPPGTAPGVIRRLAPLLRRSVISQYVTTYRATRPDSLERLHEWRILQAAARMGETTDTESARIRSWLDAALVMERS